jgi:hypothetical protein
LWLIERTIGYWHEINLLYMYRDTMTTTFLCIYRYTNFMYRMHKEWLEDL